jgi:hypothetical protein
MSEKTWARETCVTCRFVEKRSATDWRCHRLPPQTVFMVMPMESGPASMFPATDAEGWCGEYRAISEVPSGG